MKKLKVDLEDIAICMENQRYESNFYLDMETGETLAIPDEVMTALEEEEFREGLPAWELELLPQAKEIFEGSARYVEIPVRPSHEAYEAMARFTEKVKDRNLQNRLSSALKGKGAFGRFKDTLREYPEIEKGWFKFKADRDKEEVKDWLESIGIEMDKGKI